MIITVRVPATTANLGPGFDVLGLALDLWNQATFSPADEFSVTVQGEGADRLPHDSQNLIIRAAQHLAQTVGSTGGSPQRFHVDCLNRIPLGSGLGSSAAATLTGLIGANALLREPFTREEILQMATEIEGHPDNVAPALLGGLVVSMVSEDRVIARKLVGPDSVGQFSITIVVPDFDFPTKEARAVLPQQVPLKVAVHNIGRAVLVAEALRLGDLDLLSEAMDDALHQPYRLPLIPGAREAMQAAKKAGVAAVALSGAGPSLIAFSANRDDHIPQAMVSAFERAGLGARLFELGMSQVGAQVDIDSQTS
jgi:homoserine kinase